MYGFPTRGRSFSQVFACASFVIDVLVAVQVTGEPLMQRKDDNPTSLKPRLAIFHNETQPMLTYYQVRVDAPSALCALC
jgi:adenylate kinase